MDTKIYKKALKCQRKLNFLEKFAQIGLYKHTPKSIIIEKDITYGNDSNNEKCDFIYQKSNKLKKPLLIYIHGGGWISGIKNMRRSYCYNFAREGYFVANIHYDYAPQKQYPVQIQQCLNAIDFIFDNAIKFNIDTSQIVLAGESAGGYFVCELAAIAKDKSMLNKIGLKLNHLEFDVCANIIISGAIDMTKLIDNKFSNMQLMVESYTNMSCNFIRNNLDAEKVKLLSPTAYINSHFPPSMIIYANNDCLKSESFDLKKLLDSKKVKNELFKGEGFISHHAYAISVIEKKGKYCLTKTIKFINNIVKNY